jgi:hypothetical protein
VKDRQKFLIALNTLSDLHRQPLTELAIEAYWVALAEYTDDEVAAAITSSLSTFEFMPTPAGLAKLIPRRKTRMELAQDAEAASWRDR